MTQGLERTPAWGLLLKWAHARFRGPGVEGESDKAQAPEPKAQPKAHRQTFSVKPIAIWRPRKQGESSGPSTAETENVKGSPTSLTMEDLVPTIQTTPEIVEKVMECTDNADDGTFLPLMQKTPIGTST